MNLIMNPTELQEACERGTFVSLITISGSMSNVGQDFEKLMCMDINTIYTALMNLSDSQTVQDKVIYYVITVKPVLSSHSKGRPKSAFKTNYRLMQVKSIAECSAILLTFIKLPFVIKIFILSIFEWPF